MLEKEGKKERYWAESQERKKQKEKIHTYLE
jgi:hypothetical protein